MTTAVAPHTESYPTAIAPRRSMLDGLLPIRRLLGPSRIRRFSCINANACEDDMVLIDRKLGYACTVRREESVTTLAPLPKKALIRHLLTEIAPPDERL